MSLLTILFAVLIIGIIAWAITLLPIPEPFKTICWIILLLLLVLWLASGFGVVHLR